MGRRRYKPKGDYLKWRQCRRKERHNTEYEALAAIAWAKRRRFDKADLLRPYECRFCGGWHLTSLPLSLPAD